MKNDSTEVTVATSNNNVLNYISPTEANTILKELKYPKITVFRKESFLKTYKFWQVMFAHHCIASPIYLQHKFLCMFPAIFIQKYVKKHIE